MIGLVNIVVSSWNRFFKKDQDSTGDYYDSEYSIKDLKTFAQPYIVTHPEIGDGSYFFNEDGSLNLEEFSRISLDFFKYYVQPEHFETKEITDIKIHEFMSDDYLENGDGLLRQFEPEDFIKELYVGGFFDNLKIPFASVLKSCEKEKLLPPSITYALSGGYDELLLDEGITISNPHADAKTLKPQQRKLRQKLQEKEIKGTSFHEMLYKMFNTYYEKVFTAEETLKKLDKNNAIIKITRYVNSNFQSITDLMRAEGAISTKFYKELIQEYKK